MTKTENGWWKLSTAGVDSINDSDRDHIAKMIEEGYTEGELIHTADFDCLSTQEQLDLRTWYSVVSPDANDLQLLYDLFAAFKFSAWDCPECGTERVYQGDPDDWNNFQGAAQQDFTSYPGDATKYTPEYLSKMCDHCRMTAF